MQGELLGRQKQTIAELTRAKEQLVQINEELANKMKKHVKLQ